MAIDPEERKRQRREKALERQRAAARKKALLIRLGIAAAVLLLCGILIIVLARGGDAPELPSDTTQNTGIQETSTQEPDTQPPAPVTTIQVALGGDLNITDGVVASGGPAYDYTQSFMDVAHLFADADLAALNFEGILCGAPYGTDGSAPQELAQALASAGVDLLQLANSHSLNKGISGLSTTINAVRAAGMEPLGVYASRADFREGKGYVIREVSGIRIAFVAFTKGMDGLTLPVGSEDCVNLLYTDYDSTYQTVDTEGIQRVLSAAAQEDPDITIAMLHWGSEFNDTISSSQKKIVTLLQENGVDAIVGTHSHYVQQIIYDRAKGNLVAYCLGDLFGDADRSGSEYSVILNLEITRDNRTGETKLTGYSYTPVFTVREEDQPLRVVRIHEAMAAYENGYIEAVSETTYEAMKYALTRIEARIAGE